MRPIDADALVSDIESARNMFFHSPYERRFHEDRIEFALNMVEDVPTIDYVPRQQWISVKDRLPETNKLVLCVGAKGGMFLGEILFKNPVAGSEIYHFFVPNARQGRSATHWMPLPQPPKEEEE
jgi:hypothetical protein